ncbi:MAG: ATP synthase F1 subunit delta [Alphaproteobacteria bacterium]|nr:ATP synthase F1 subunit delta [Alphaproteobacteria bacterium]NCQ66320.1 ATP synthase F1 subunit delta [Alphaproteobacteria bacterium]NCT06806.1 ATP synthase F1 subunit delta [Alphaproteobacteria bacterium]
MKKVAARYAAALFQLAETAEEKERYYKDLGKLKSWMLGSSNFSMLITNPLLPQKLVKKIMSEICTQGKASVNLTNFFLHIIDQRRIKILPEIIEAYRDLFHQENHIENASIETAHSLTKELEETFKSVLETRFKTKLIFNFKVNTELLGGFRAQVGSHQIDSSLMTQLANLSRTLKGAS